MVVGDRPAQIDAGELRRGYGLLIDPASPVFVQELPTGRWRVAPAGDFDALLAAATELSESKGAYWIFNPLPAGHAGTVRVEDVTRRHNLFIDIDPIKARGHENDNASDEEHEKTREVAAAIVSELMTGFGWPEPAMIASGNGTYLFYRADLPNTPHSRSLLKSFLASLAGRHPGAIVDPTVINANRLAKIPGTWARKGPNSAERPHRLCRVLFAPPALEIVTAEQIAAATPSYQSTAPAAEVPAAAPANGASPNPFRPQAVDGDRGRAYARKALEGECGKLALAPVGRRNQTFNDAVLKLAGLVAGGHIARQEVEDALKPLARQRGLDEAEVEATWESAFNAGCAQPRHLSEQTDSAPGRGRAKAPSGSAADAVPDGQLIIVRAASIQPRKVEWLWPGRIALGKLTTFAGQGGLGKTFVMLDIAARVTRGLAWPDSEGACCEAGQVLLLSGEDDPDDTLVPRLIELGADMTRVAFLTYEVQDRFTLADLKTLGRALEEMGPGVRFVGIDPPSCFLGDVDDHRNAEVRALLSPLRSWAARHRLAVVFNTHFTKTGGAKIEVIQRVMGSAAWVNAVRAAHAFVADPDDNEAVLFLPMKMNLAKRKRGLRFRIVETNSETQMAQVQWLGEVDLTADDAVSRERNKPRREVAVEWLVERFRQKLEWRSDELFAAAKAAGISRNAVFEAKEQLGLPKARKRTLDNGDVVWEWWVPGDWPQLSPETDSCSTCNTCTEEEF
jgi:hypothetical protein